MKNKVIFILLISAIITGLFSPVSVRAKDENKRIVTLGADLTNDQRLQMLKRFEVTENQIEKDEIKEVEVTIQDIREQLGMDTSKPVAKGSVSISSCYVEVLPKGKGISVTTNNLTEVNKNMLSNAIVTSGITDAKVIADAPYKVTGTAALAGILKGFEQSMGKELPLENKEVARDEINVTKSLGNEIGPDKAASLINDAKTEVIKEKPKDKEEIVGIVDKTADRYDVKLSESQQQSITDLLTKLNDLDLNYKDLKGTLSKLNDTMTKSLEKSGVILQENNTILKKISRQLDRFGSFIKGIFNKDSIENIEPADIETKKTQIKDTIDDLIEKVPAK
ncbi:DUF1002 domain-containing protein [Clostridium algidicarnis]|uniref:Uncharacterized protein YpuA (DUF1002 family) n=1 Tax=Clostridium algidicarnis DSM 15099 TaxID=1121295 RepID=A0A2S6G0J5_9CLOT|nr:DUF1002 domain-containing protein [Clostridium algidicarnis]MBB6630792.1 DUF1002 domain-containing protein [Clostridium algidicarnis]MBB6696501.1 DUF1002 domain-containing protein [Clostridium algidicarnis]PPK49408.1 uncharacterized protein YpuA (DUF1002 family) [Clostridium algidicarnis DSM 15099]